MSDFPLHAASTFLVTPAANWPELWERIVADVHPSDRWSPEDWSKSLAIKDIRTVQQFAGQGAVGKGRVVALPHADQFTRETANALLKLLEEPPAGLSLVLFGETDRMLATVRSRVQVVPVASELVSEKRLTQFYQQLNALQKPELTRRFLYYAPLFHATLQTDAVLDSFQS